jgi:hypothetical protein
MNRVQRLSLSIYIIFFIPTLALAYCVVAPFLSRLCGIDATATRWAVLAVTSAGGIGGALVVMRDERPLRRLGILLSYRPYRSTSIFLSEPASRYRNDDQRNDTSTPGDIK